MEVRVFRVISWIVPGRWENEDDPRNHTKKHEQNTPESSDSDVLGKAVR